MPLRNALSNLLDTNSLRLEKSPGIVLDEDFPDPESFYDTASSTWYFSCTNGTRGNIPLWSTPTPYIPGSYTFIGDMLPNASVPASMTLGQTWAPAMAKLGSTYIIYTTAKQSSVPSGGKHAIWYGTSTSVTGPYTWSAQPLIVRDDLGGAIDPKFFPDPATGVNYVLYKGDTPGASGAVGTTPLNVVPVDFRGTTIVGPHTTILTNERNWETAGFSNIEAACIRLRGTKYFLFYSALYYGDNNYNSCYAVANNFLGPYMKPSGPQIMSDDSMQVWGPGGATIATMQNGTDYILFHSWNVRIAGGAAIPGGAYRRLFCWKLVYRAPSATNIGG